MFSAPDFVFLDDSFTTAKNLGGHLSPPQPPSPCFAPAVMLLLNIDGHIPLCSHILVVTYVTALCRSWKLWNRLHLFPSWMAEKALKPAFSSVQVVCVLYVLFVNFHVCMCRGSLLQLVMFLCCHYFSQYQCK